MCVMPADVEVVVIDESGYPSVSKWFCERHAG